MTNEQINAAIAEACGFVCLHEFQVDKDGAKFGFWEYPPTWTGPKKQPWCLDFCTDLNAMHEAETVLDYEQCEAFSNAVADIVHAANREKDYPFPWCFARIHATARQRAEAFLRTLNKWEDK